jgi:hypothetical protein
MVSNSGMHDEVGRGLCSTTIYAFCASQALYMTCQGVGAVRCVDVHVSCHCSVCVR